MAIAPQQGLAGRGPLTFPHTPPAFLCRVPNAELPSSPTGSDLFHLLLPPSPPPAAAAPTFLWGKRGPLLPADVISERFFNRRDKFPYEIYKP